VKASTFSKTPMFISGIPHIKTLFQSLPGTFVGVGMTAYSRIVPASFLKAYHIVALHPTGDLPLLRKQTPIFCLLEETKRGTPERNSAALMAHPLTRRFVDGLSDPKYFFLYQDYPELRSLAETHGWRLLANSPELRQRAGKRDFFKKMTAQLGLPQIPGDMCPIGAIHQKGYEEWRHQLGPVFVVQLPEIERGGGRGTFFVRTAEDYLKLQGRLRENRWRDTPLETVSLKPFMEGIPASVTACVTRHGTLVSALQRQLLDLPYCRDFAENGVFCGHAWGVSPWSVVARKSAFEQASKIGAFLSTLGYKGILGIDFIVQEEKVYPIEINPRLTGALPMLSLLHLQRGTIPLEAFHMLEFLDIPYRMDLNALNSRYAQTVQGSHLLIFRPQGVSRHDASLNPGLYEYEPKHQKFHFLKETLSYGDIESEKQFILSDGPRLEKSKESPSRDSHSRLCRLLFSYPVVDIENSLSPQALLAAAWVQENAA